MLTMESWGVKSVFESVKARIVGFPEHVRQNWKTSAFWLTFAAYAIPLSLLLYVLYINFLPFGYSATYTISVGSPSDTSGAFYLEPSRNLSERKTAADGTTYREFSGTINAVFNPGVVLKNAKVSVTVQSLSGQANDEISVTTEQSSFDPNSVKWNYSWDFSKGIPTELTGNALLKDGCGYFDGSSQLEFPDSQDQFENGPFTVYAEWTPENSTDNFQEIVGHYNWELLQNSNSVSFQVGRMNDAGGPFYYVKFPVKAEFFDKKHSAIAIYSPSKTEGKIELYVDGSLVGQTAIETNTIWTNYGEKNLTFGKAGHGAATYFKGCLKKVDFQNGPSTKDGKYNFSGKELRVVLKSVATTTLTSVKIDVH